MFITKYRTLCLYLPAGTVTCPPHSDTNLHRKYTPPLLSPACSLSCYRSSPTTVYPGLQTVVCYDELVMIGPDLLLLVSLCLQCKLSYLSCSPGLGYCSVFLCLASALTGTSPSLDCLGWGLCCKQFFLYIFYKILIFSSILKPQ